MRGEPGAAAVGIGAGVGDIEADPAQRFVAQKAEGLVVGGFQGAEFSELRVVARGAKRVAGEIGIIDAERRRGVVERLTEIRDFGLRRIEGELAGRAPAEIIREPGLIALGVLREQAGVGRGDPGVDLVHDPEAGDVVDGRTRDALVEAGVKLEIAQDIVFGGHGRKPVLVARTAGEARLAFELVADALERRRTAAIRAGGINGVAGGDHLGAHQRIELAHRVRRLLKPDTETDLQLRRGAGIKLGVAGIHRLAKFSRARVVIGIVVLRRGGAHKLLGVRVEEVGHRVAVHARGHALDPVHVEQGQPVRRAHVEGVGRHERGADIGPVAGRGVLERAGRRVHTDGVAVQADVRPDLRVVVGAVVAVLLVPLAAKFCGHGEFPERQDPFGIELAAPDLGRPKVRGVVGARAAVAGVRIGEAAEVEPVVAGGLPDGPLPRLGIGAGRDETPGGAAAFGTDERALQRFIVVQRTRIARRAVDHPGVELVFETGRKRAGVGQLRGRAVAVGQRGHRVCLAGGRAAACDARGDDGRHAVAGDAGAPVGDGRVGIVVGGDKREAAVPELPLRVRVNRVERKHELPGRLPVRGQQQGVLQNELRAVLEKDLPGHHRTRVVDIGGAVVVRPGDVLLGIRFGVAGAHEDAEALVEEGLGVVEFVVRLDLAFLLVGRPVGLAQREFLSVEVEAGIETVVAAFAVKRTLGLHVDRAGGGVGIGLGARRAADLDGLDGRDGKALEAGGARRVPAAAVGVGAGGPHPVERDADILSLHAAETRAARLGFHVVQIHPRQILQELAHIAVGHVAKNIGRNRGRDVHVAPLVHDRLRIAFPLGGDGEGRELDDTVAGLGPRGGGRADEIDFADRRLAGRNGQGLRDGVIARVGHRDRRGADGHPGKLERAVALGIGHLIRALEADLGVADIFLRSRIVDPALNDAGAARLGAEAGDEEEPAERERGQCREAATGGRNRLHGSDFFRERERHDAGDSRGGEPLADFAAGKLFANITRTIDAPAAVGWARVAGICAYIVACLPATMAARTPRPPAPHPRPLCRGPAAARSPQGCLHRLAAGPKGPGRRPRSQRPPRRRTPHRPTPPVGDAGPTGPRSARRRRTASPPAPTPGPPGASTACAPAAVPRFPRARGRRTERSVSKLTAYAISASAWAGGQLSAATRRPKIGGSLRGRARLPLARPAGAALVAASRENPHPLLVTPPAPLPSSAPRRRSRPPPPRRKNSLTTS